MCRHMYDWNIVDCDVKQPIHSLTWQTPNVHSVLAREKYVELELYDLKNEYTS